MTDPPARRVPAAAVLVAAGLVTPPLRHLANVHAVPPGAPWRSACPDCGTGLAPSAAAARPGGRCGGCGRRIGPPPYAVELATLAAAALVGVAVAGGGWTGTGGALAAAAAAVGLAGWAAVAVPLTFVDLAVHRLPDRLTLPAAAWVLAWLGIAAALGGGAGGAWVRAALAGAGCGAGFGLVALVLGARGYGLGDAKLAVSAGAVLAWAGWGALFAGLFLAFLASGLVAAGLLVARRVRWRDALPFGPFLIGGTLVAAAWVGLSGYPY